MSSSTSDFLKRFVGIALVACAAGFLFSCRHGLDAVDYSSFRLGSAPLFWLRLLLALAVFQAFFISRLRFLESNLTPCVLALFFFVWMLWFKWSQHLAFHTHSHDVGLFHSVISNTAHGNFMWDSVRDRIFLSDHLMFFLIFLAPFYWIYNGPEMLFVLSAISYAAAGVILYKLAFERLQDRYLALAVALTFWLHRYVWAAFQHEFHPDFFAPLFFFLIFLSFDKKSKGAFFASLFFILTLREDYALYLIPVGIYFFIHCKPVGALTILFGAGYAVTAFSMILPYYYKMAGIQSGYTYLGSWSNLGGGFGEVFRNFVTEPHVLISELSFRTLSNFFARFLGLPFLSPASLIFLMPPLLLFASSQFPLIKGLSIHYGLIPAAFGLIASIEGIRVLSGWLKEKGRIKLGLVVSVLLAVGVSRLTFYVPVKEAFLFPSVRSEILKHENLCVQSSLYPHLTPKSGISIFPECAKDHKYLLLHKNADPFPLSSHIFSEEFYGKRRSLEWDEAGEWGDLVLFEKAEL